MHWNRAAKRRLAELARVNWKKMMKIHGNWFFGKKAKYWKFMQCAHIYRYVVSLLGVSGACNLVGSVWPVDDIWRLHYQRGTVEYQSGDLAGVNSQKMLKIDQNLTSSFVSKKSVIPKRHGGAVTVSIFGTRAIEGLSWVWQVQFGVVSPSTR